MTKLRGHKLSMASRFCKICGKNIDDKGLQWRTCSKKCSRRNKLNNYNKVNRKRYAANREIIAQKRSDYYFFKNFENYLTGKKRKYKK